MERLNQRLEIAQKALTTFDEVLNQKYNTFIRDSAILRFQYTTEATWKLAQLFLRTIEGIEVASPKSTMRACFDAKLLDEQQTKEILGMVDDRNLAVHTYNDALAEALFSRLANHHKLIGILLTAIEKRIKNHP